MCIGKEFSTRPEVPSTECASKTGDRPRIPTGRRSPVRGTKKRMKGALVVEHSPLILQRKVRVIDTKTESFLHDGGRYLIGHLSIYKTLNYPI